MSCRDYEESLALAMDGELEAARRESLERHLAVCAGCRRFQQELEHDRDWLREPVPYSEAELPELRGLLRTRIETRGPDRRRLLAASVLLALFGSWLLWPRSTPAPREPLRVERVLPPSFPPAAEPRLPQLAEAEPDVEIDTRAEIQVAAQAPTPAIPQPRTTTAATPGESLVIHVVTDDPGLVILWLIDPVETYDETETS